MNSTQKSEVLNLIYQYIELSVLAQYSTEINNKI